MTSSDSLPDLDHLPAGLRFLAGGGEATRLVLARDWSGHPLGRPETWPDTLKVSLSLVLNSPESMIFCWGREQLTFFFNETYIPMLGPRVSWAMGSTFKEVWAEALEQAMPIIEEAFEGRSRHFVDLPWKLGTDRGARDTWWSFSYSRVLDADGGIAGLFIFTNETTSRVLADTAARESQERLRLETERQRHSLQQMPGFVAILAGPTHVFEYVNDAYIEMSGPRSFIKRTVRDVLPELEDQGFYELLDRVYVSGEPFIARAMPIHFHGETTDRYIDFVYQPVRDDPGAVTGIFVGGYDVTERVRVERRREALLRLDERLRDVGDTAALSHAASELLGEALGVARVGYGFLDTRERTIAIERDWTMPGSTSVAGVHRFSNFGSYIEELLRGIVVQIADVETDPRSAAKVDSFRAIGVRALMDVPVLEHGQPVAQMFVHSRTPRVWTDEEAVFVRDFAERTRVAIARRRAEQQLRASETRLANAVSSAQLGTFTWDPATGEVELDARSREIFGLPEAGALRASDIFGRIARDQVEAVDHAAVSAAQRGQRIASAYDIILADGSSRYVSSSAVPFVDAAGRRRMVGVFHDLTELKEAERMLREQSDTLAARVAERTAELEAAHEQLRQSQKMEAVGQLTGGLAHDFNNLLAGISGSLELMGMRLSQGRIQDVEKYLTAAQGAARRAAALTHRLLAFSRRQTLDPKPTNVNQLVAGMEELVRRTVGPAIQVEVVGASGLWTALVDPPQLENALLNLCINARDAMPDGGRITIETANKWIDHATARKHDMPEGQYLSLCVSDTGTGMPPDVITKAFDPFFTTKPIGAGTGLGLSMIYGFAKQSGGQVRIYSEVGQGTTVCIYLPREMGRAEDADALTGGTALPRAEQGQTVLVVDDEPTVRMLVTDVLEGLGYNAIEAHDSVAGLRILQSETRIDLLVTDVGLPGGMNGRQMADAARTTRPGLKVLFITGYAENALLRNGQLGPGMAVLTKPFPIETLGARISEMIDG